MVAHYNYTDTHTHDYWDDDDDDDDDDKYNDDKLKYGKPGLGKVMCI